MVRKYLDWTLGSIFGFAVDQLKCSLSLFTLASSLPACAHQPPHASAISGLPQIHTRRFFAGEGYIFTGSHYSQGLLHTICNPVVTHRLRMKLTRPTNIFTSKGITGIAHIVCTIVERQCCAKRYYACTLHIAMLHKSWHGWANLLLGDWLVRPTWWVCFEFWCWTTVGMWWGTWRVFLEDTGAPSFQPSRKSKMRFNF